MIKSYEVSENLIEFSFEENDIEDGSLTLSPKEVMESIKKMREALFSWSKLTGKRVDDPECH